MPRCAGPSRRRIGGPRAYQTYILLANPNTTPAEVQVRFLKKAWRRVIRTYMLLPTSRLNIAPASDIPSSAPVSSARHPGPQTSQPIVVEKAMYWNSGTENLAAGTGHRRHAHSSAIASGRLASDGPHPRSAL